MLDLSLAIGHIDGMITDYGHNLKIPDSVGDEIKGAIDILKYVYDFNAEKFFYVKYRGISVRFDTQINRLSFRKKEADILRWKMKEEQRKREKKFRQSVEEQMLQRIVNAIHNETQLPTTNIQAAIIEYLVKNGYMPPFYDEFDI